MKIQKKISLAFSILMAAISLYVSAIFYERTINAHFEDLRRNVKELATAASLLIDAEKHQKISQTFDASLPEYQELRNKLIEFRKSQPRIKYAYTMVASTEPDKFKFVIDASEPRDEDGDGKISPEEDITPPGEDYDVSEFPEMKNSLLEGKADADKKLSSDKWGTFLSGYAPIRDANNKVIGIVGLDITAETIIKEQRAFQIRIAIIFLSAIILTFFVSSIVSRRLTRPIQKLIEGARIIGSGDFNHKIIVKSKDEIEQLAQSMNEMAENISDKLSKLKILNKVSENLSSSIELQKALKTSLDIVFELTGASTGLILLADNTESRVEIAISEGVTKPKFVDDDAFIGHKRFTTRLGENFREWVKKPENNQVWSIEELKKIPDAAPAVEWLDATNCNFIAPLIFKDSLRGFFLYSNRLEGSKDFLRTLFYQITMAIENARLYYSAVTDGLTGLYIRRYFQLTLEQEFQRARRYDRKFSLLMIDIDHFKSINDTYGHQTGDAVLKEVAKILKYQTREVDIVARYGGEEMSIILPETDLEGALLTAEKIRSTVERYQFPDGLKVTISIGAATCDKDFPQDKETLIKLADEALYKAKEGGRNRVVAASRDTTK